ncbi:MAG TPA: PilT/PilU family type 4a pilus ATPase [Bryobacteraceae bacterium]|jgi:twitching motility protein PilT|nr:PilT/PilU family type 4a pilus ATPase [Bryobacteraceae bacterium]
MPGYENQLEQLVAELNRAAPGEHAPKPGITQAFQPVVSDASRHDGELASLDAVLNEAARRGASDLLLIADVPVTLRIGGALSHSFGPPLSAESTRNLLLPLMTPAGSQELERNRFADLCFSRPGIGRFRANIHFQRGTLAGSIRLLPEKIPTLESLHLPQGLRSLAEARQGLVLVTGPTGSGKSSTLAALVDLINNTRHDHVVTIEDPVEYVHSNRKAIIEQIEVGRDAPDFAGSLRGILRQNPDVILVGEMRDSETMQMVLTAAETGHLVLSTLHTNDASQAVSRILDSFPRGNQPQIRQQLSLALLAVIAQQLVPAAKGGRYPVIEILRASSGVRSLIRKGDDHQLYSTLSTGRNEGMISMEQSLADTVRSGRISRDTAVAHCFRPEDLARYLQG